MNRLDFFEPLNLLPRPVYCEVCRVPVFVYGPRTIQCHVTNIDSHRSSLSSPIYLSSLVFSLTSRYSRKEIESYFALQRQQYPDGKLCDPMTQQELISSVLTPALEVQADLDRLYPRQTAGDTGVREGRETRGVRVWGGEVGVWMICACRRM